MKKDKKIISMSLVLLAALLMPACNSSKNSSGVENYYVINVNSIRTEMLVNSTVILEPTFTNLGEVATPNYAISIKLNNEDVTSKCYKAQSREFTPTETGTYAVTFTVLDNEGNVYTTKDGSTFTQVVMIEVVTQSFAPRNSAGPDVTVSEEGVITFGDSYSAGSTEKITSNQYKVTGVTFEGSYSITYKLEDIKYDAVYSDPALYFGWVRDRAENNDDSVKVSSGNGTVAAWIWGDNGGLADLSVNRNHGWAPGGWYNAPGSITGGVNLAGDHTLTFERFVNKDANVATLGIIFDGVPYTYLNMGSNYTDLLTNVWVESNNTSGSISVEEYKKISDTQAPSLTLDFEASKFYTGDSINLKARAVVSDDSAYSSVIAPTFKVYDKDGIEQAVNSGTFTPALAGEYKVVATASDLAMNTTTVESKLVVEEPIVADTVIDVSQTTSVAMPNSGVVLYSSATKDDAPVGIASIQAFKGNEEVTSSTIFRHNSSTVEGLYYDYFKAPAGNYRLVFTAEDGTTKEKEISVADSNTTVYGYTYYDIGTLIHEDKFIVGKDLIIYLNNGANDRQTVKLGYGLKNLYDWTIEFDITDMAYSAQGKFFITKNTLNQEGTSIGWEDLTVGGNCKPDGSPDLWGYECSVIGSGWVSYQWRSNWQDKTTEFMPDPEDPTKGCGRPADAYSQYATGTHSYKIECTMDATTGRVTYTYYIDGETEVVHVTKDAHNWGNGIGFIQFSGHHFNGIVSNIRVY